LGCILVEDSIETEGLILDSLSVWYDAAGELLYRIVFRRIENPGSVLEDHFVPGCAIFISYYSQASIINNFDDGSDSSLCQLGSTGNAGEGPIAEEQRCIIAFGKLGSFSNGKGPHSDRHGD
jgi:hypothetical protein